VTRFINGLGDDLKGEVSLHHPESSMEAYKKALENKKYKKPSYSSRWSFQAGEYKPPSLSLFRKPLTLRDNQW